MSDAPRWAKILSPWVEICGLLGTILLWGVNALAIDVETLPNTAHSTHAVAPPPIQQPGPACADWQLSWPPAMPGSDLIEMSGIASSTLYADKLYHVTDSGNAPVIFITDLKGNIAAKVRYRQTAWDVEALSKGRCPWDGRCLFSADIGDNLHFRAIKRIDAIDENSLFEPPLKSEHIEFRLPYQLILDMEALAIHPVTGDLFVFSKEVGRSRVFKLPAEVWKKPHEVHTAMYVGQMPHCMLSDATWSRDGKRLLLTSYRGIFERSLAKEEGSHLEDGWYPYERDLHLPMLRQQEAVTYLSDDRSVAYSSEKKRFRNDRWGLVIATCRDVRPK